MTAADRWILPDGIEEVLPPKAGNIENLRRTLLDTYRTWGYDLVIPPLAEYLESLLTGVGHDLDLLTFKLTDQLSGRLMGLSADSTQQVARMDAHSLKKEGVARYCYCSPVLHTRPASIHVNRSPIQIGAELYGHRDVQCDIEIVSLMLASLQSIGLKDLTLDLGHVGIYRALTQYIELPTQLEQELYRILRSQSLPDLDHFISQHRGQYPKLEKIALLTSLVGDESVLDKAQQQLGDLGEAITGPLSRISAVADAIKTSFPKVHLHIDLAELKDLNYHTGLVFSAFAPDKGIALAKGGRYDDTGVVFGRARSATGFSADLKVLADLLTQTSTATAAVLAPIVEDPSQKQALEAKVAELRAQGVRVIQSFGLDTDTQGNLGTNQTLALENGQWVVKPNE